MGKKHFCFFQTAETGNRTPDSGVKGSGANHYPRAPAQCETECGTECIMNVTLNVTLALTLNVTLNVTQLSYVVIEISQIQVIFSHFKQGVAVVSGYL